MAISYHRVTQRRADGQHDDGRIRRREGERHPGAYDPIRVNERCDAEREECRDGKGPEPEPCPKPS